MKGHGFNFWNVKATYMSGCFCERPELPIGLPIALLERLQWKKALAEYVEAHGLTEVMNGKGHVATALLTFTCHHRTEQVIRLETDYSY